MAGDGCKGGFRKSLPIPAKAPPQGNQLPMVEEKDWSSEGEFDEDYMEGEFDKDSNYEENDEEDKVGGESSDEDDEEDGNGENECDELPDEFYLVEAVRKKRVRQGEPQYLIKWLGWPETANTWEPMENLESISDMIDEFEESLPKKKQQKKPSPSPVVTKKKNVSGAKVGKTECSKGQPDEVGTKLIISEPKQSAVPKTNQACEDKPLQRFKEAQSVGLTGKANKKRKRKSGPAAKKFKFPSKFVDIWNLGDDHFADKDLD